MSEKRSASALCVSITGAPPYTTENQFLQVLHKHVPNAKIQRLKFENSTSFKKWILLLDSSECVEVLCDDVQEEELVIDHESHTITFQLADQSDIPVGWTQGECDAFQRSRHSKAQDENEATYSFSNSFEREMPDRQAPIIKLSDLPQDVDEEYLKMFFDDEEIFGTNLNVKQISIDRGHSSAVVEFRDKNEVDFVLEKQPLEIEGHTVTAKLYEHLEETEVSPRTIEVTAAHGVLRQQSISALKMYFRSKTYSNGGEIEKCVIEPDSEVLHITYKDHEVARNVASKPSHTLRNQELHVVLLDPSSVEECDKSRDEKVIVQHRPTKIVMTNLPCGVDKFVLELFFGDDDTFGKCLQVERIEFDPDQSSAFVEFGNPEDVETVLSKQPLTIEEHVIQIEVQDDDVEEQRTVEVRGPNDIITEARFLALKMYFKNVRYSGGGPLTDCNLEEPGIATITFEKHEVAKRVAEKQDHEFMSHKLEVFLKSPKMSTKKSQTGEGLLRKMVITGLTEVIGENLTLYLEDLFEEVRVTSVELRDDHSKAVVEVDDPKAVDMILKQQPIVIDGIKLGVEKYKDEQKCKVEIRGLKNIERNLEALKMYLKIPKRSGGGAITKCTTRNDIVYVTFESEEAAQRVVDKKSHTLADQELCVTFCKPEEVSESGKENRRKILLSNLPKQIDKEFIVLFLEVMAESIDIHVENVDIDSEEQSAVVEFTEQIAADAFLQHKELKMKENTVLVGPYNEKKGTCSTIEVSGRSDIENEMDTLRLYFRHRGRSGGGPIVDSSCKGDVAYFTFESEEVTRRVVDSDHSRQGLTVKLKTEKTPKDEPVDLPRSTVKVRGVTKEISKETLLLYFENERHSGGGHVVSLSSDDEEDDTMYVNFANHRVAKKVVEREHTLQGMSLRVSLYTPLPYYDNKILIKGLKSTTTKDALILFLEARAGVEPVGIDYHEDEEDTVLVTIKNKLEFETIEKACKERQLEGAYLTVSRVHVSNCILVSNLAPQTSKDMILYYFENTKKSGGGWIDKVVMNETDDSCLVYFEDYRVIGDVIQQHHELRGNTLNVKCFQRALGRAEGEKEKTFQIPSPIEVPNVNLYKIKFVANSEDKRNAIERELCRHYVDIKWPSGKASVQLVCTLSKDVKGCFKIAKSWGKQARSKFESLMDDIVFHRVEVLHDIKQKVIEFLKTINIKNPSSVAIFIENEQRTIIIVGQKSEADNLKETIEISIKKIVNQAEKERQKVKDTLTNLKPVELKLLETERFSQTLENEFPDLKVHVNAEKCEIVFEGMIGSVQGAKLKIFEKKCSFTAGRIHNVSKLSMALYTREETMHFIQHNLKADGIVAVWEVSDTALDICCMEQKMYERGERIIRESVLDDRIHLKTGEVPDLKTEKWKRKVDEINSLHPGKVQIKVDEGLRNVEICATSDIMGMVSKDIKSFLQSHTVIRKKIIHSSHSHRLIEKYYRPKVEEIEKKFHQYFVKITFLEQYGGFEITGLNKGVQDAYTLLFKLLQSIKQKQHTISKPGIAEHVRSSKGKDSINTIENNLSCEIAVEGDEAFKQMSEKMHGSGAQASCRVFDTRNICVWHGDMTELGVDLIINPSDKSLRFVGGLGKAILSKGGKTIQYECDDYISSHGALQDDDIFIGRGGNLKAKHIAHIKSQEWKPGQDKERILEACVMNCLLEASKLQVNSVAIPAIGCGANGFPVDISATCIVSAIRKVFLEYQDSSVSEVYLSDMNTKNVEGFTQALMTTFGGKNVMMNDADNVPPSKTYNEDTGNSLTSTFTKLEGIRQHKNGSVVVGNTLVTVIKGEIAKQRADVIVNTTSFNLDLRNGTVSLTLLKAAGKELQSEVKSKYPDGLKKLDLAVTGGHKLACSIVIHTALSNYNAKEPKAGEEAIYKLVYNCLTEAQNHGYTSIVFPAVGTGNLGYPRHIVAKEMFNAVSVFSRTNPQSSIRDIKFVVYHLDTETVTAFENEQTQLQCQKQSKTTLGHLDTTDLGYDVVQQDDFQSANGIYTFGSITVTVRQGDLIKEDADCIVNSTNDDLNLSIGKVSQIILEKGGHALREELENHKSEMKTKKITMTLAPGLTCKNIIHVVTDPNNLTGTVKHCLAEAEYENMTSIAFPALGTGVAGASDHVVSAETARTMIKAVRDFADNTQPKYLMDIRFVIFQKEMLADFQKAVENASDPKTWLGKAAGNMWKGFKNVFGMTGGVNRDVKTAVEEADFNSVTFVIMAFSDNVIRKAVQCLESSLEKEIVCKTIDDHVIPLLEDAQVQEMYGIAKQWHVEMAMNKSKAFIQISGIVGNVMHASDKISGLIRDAERMELMQNIAQWFFIEKNNTSEVKPYDRDINLAIETAYRQKKDIVSFLIDGEDYIVDFASMEAYPEKHMTEKVKVIRRDLVKGIGTFEPPPDWEDMKGEHLRVVNVAQGTTEYTCVEKKFKSSLGKKSFTVEKIERIQNKTLWEQYQSKKKQLETQNPKNTQNERELWHGTSVEPVDSINAHGFNRSYCGKNATVYGDGVYFAINAEYSCQDTYSRPDKDRTKRVYLCRVLSGEFTKGEKGMRVPPPKPSGGPHALYDSVTNDVNNPTMFIIFHDTQACPEYMLYFKA